MYLFHHFFLQFRQFALPQFISRPSPSVYHYHQKNCVTTCAAMSEMVHKRLKKNEKGSWNS